MYGQEMFKREILENRRNLIILVVVLVGLALLVVVAMIFSGPEGELQPVCKFQGMPPRFDDARANKTRIAKDKNGLLRLLSYTTYHDTLKGESYNLPDELVSFTVLEIDKYNRKTMSINMNCSKIIMHLRRNESGYLISDEIKMEIHTPEGFERSCSIESPIVWNAGLEHYKCDQMDYFKCKLKYSNNYFAWQVVGLEFEVDGSASMTEQGLWSTGATNCGRTTLSR